MINNTQALYWRYLCFPRMENCSSDIDPQKPTQIPVANITFQRDILATVVNWEPPEYTNGELRSYEVCLSEEELEGEEDCNEIFRSADVPSLVLSAEDFQTNQANQLAVQVHYIIITIITARGINTLKLPRCYNYYTIL